MIEHFELRRKIDGKMYQFVRHDKTRFKRSDGDYWIVNRDPYGWIAWDFEAQDIQGRPWAVLPKDQTDAPPEGDWVSKKGHKSFVYELVYVRSG